MTPGMRPRSGLAARRRSRAVYDRAAAEAAVGSAQCLPCICDANGVGGVLSGDAQLVLRAAVGQSVVLACPDCD